MVAEAGKAPVETTTLGLDGTVEGCDLCLGLSLALLGECTAGWDGEASGREGAGWEAASGETTGGSRETASWEGEAAGGDDAAWEVVVFTLVEVTGRDCA